MRPELYERVVLTHDVPSENLKKGEVATLVDYLEHPSVGEDGAILEVFNAVGESSASATLPVSAIATLTDEYMPAARPIHETA